MHRAALARSEERRQEINRLHAELVTARAELNEATERIITPETELADVEEALFQARATIARVEALCAAEEADHKPGRARYAAAWVKDIRAALDDASEGGQ